MTTITIVLGLLRRRLVAVTVQGPSMAPAYRHGDRVLVVRTKVDRLRRGQVVVVERPRPDGSWRPRSSAAPPRWMIKRLAALPGDPVPADLATDATAVPPGMLVLLGDNEESSYDSRQVGFFPAERLLGVAVRKMRSKPGTTTTLGIPDHYDRPAR